MSESKNSTQTYDLNLLRKSETKWNRSASLRNFYESIYHDIRDRMKDGPSLELGSGIGKSKNYIPNLTTSDLIQTEFVDVACSAYNIPPGPDNLEENAAWSNILAVDVLHHLCHPMAFFESAACALEKNGRIILVEPAATGFGKLFYKVFHREPIHMDSIKPPFEFFPDDDSGEFANMGMGVGLFAENLVHVRNLLAEFSLEVREINYRDFIAYPLTGGYSGPQFAPSFLVNFLLKTEKLTPRLIFRGCGLRMIITLQRQ